MAQHMRDSFDISNQAARVKPGPASRSDLSSQPKFQFSQRDPDAFHMKNGDGSPLEIAQKNPRLPLSALAKVHFPALGFVAPLHRATGFNCIDISARY